MRSAVFSLARSTLRSSMEFNRGGGGGGSAISGLRYFSDDKGRVLSEEERAAENVYIKKMEKEKKEKLKLKEEKEKAEKEKSDKKTSGS